MMMLVAALGGSGAVSCSMVEHQPNGMTECLEFARPMVRRGTGLNAHQTWWQLLKECQNRPPLQLTTNGHLATSVNAVNLEN